MTKKQALKDMQERCSICKRDALPSEKECENCYFPIAIESIEKQIPIKAKTNKEGFNCSRCGRSHHIILNYCCWCGQKFEEKEV